jgi:ligand-binding SRPBCC domain-containing protein
VNAPVKVVWDFIATPRNLNRITPEELSFEILNHVPEVMFNGLLIEYKVNIPYFGRWRWLTEIKHIIEGRSFVDEQRAGPYKFWYHYHEVQPHPQGTMIIDKVSYQMPFWLLGDLVNAFIVQKQLNQIFDYREVTFAKLFEATTI